MQWRNKSILYRWVTSFSNKLCFFFQFETKLDPEDDEFARPASRHSRVLSNSGIIGRALDGSSSSSSSFSKDLAPVRSDTMDEDEQEALMRQMELEGAAAERQRNENDKAKEKEEEEAKAARERARLKKKEEEELKIKKEKEKQRKDEEVRLFGVCLISLFFWWWATMKLWTILRLSITSKTLFCWHVVSCFCLVLTLSVVVNVCW